MWADAPSVEFDADRFERAFAELEASAYAERSLTVVAVAIEGLLLESDEVALADGLVLVRAATLAERPDDLDVGEDDAVALVRLECAAGDPVPLEDAGRRLRRLQTALRLWDDAEPGLDATAHARIDGGPWFAVGLGTGARRSRDVCELFEEDEDQLRAFCSLVTRRTPRGGELAWALRRFELGCERAAATDALTDWLLALRALLEPEGPQSGRLGERLAAICALPEHRGALARRVAHLCALERQVITGMARHEPHLDARVSELGGHLRAVLRDVLCGHLDPALSARSPTSCSRARRPTTPRTRFPSRSPEPRRGARGRRAGRPRRARRPRAAGRARPPSGRPRPRGARDSPRHARRGPRRR